MMKLTDKQIEVVRDKRVMEREMQIALINWWRPPDRTHITDEREILSRLHFRSYRTGLSPEVDKRYEELKKKYVGQFTVKWASLAF